MKIIFKFYLLPLIIFYVCINNLMSQTSSCNQSALTPNYIVPANTTSIIPSNTVVAGVFYLCGPNSYLLDTASAFGCRDIMLNAGCKFVTNSSGCPAANYIYAKNSSTVIIKPGTQAITYLIYEPGAVIIDQVGLTYTFACTSISFPTVNCGVTSVAEKNINNRGFEIFPNPANDQINLKLYNDFDSNDRIEIINSIGQMLKIDEITLNNEIINLKVNDLPNGIYLLNIYSNNKRNNSKHFVVSR